jgi:hypothetical protein
MIGFHINPTIEFMNENTPLIPITGRKGRRVQQDNVIQAVKRLFVNRGLLVTVSALYMLR